MAKVRHRKVHLNLVEFFEWDIIVCSLFDYGKNPVQIKNIFQMNLDLL